VAVGREWRQEGDRAVGLAGYGVDHERLNAVFYEHQQQAGADVVAAVHACVNGYRELAQVDQVLCAATVISVMTEICARNARVKP
jgi:hypothetical protein